MERSQPTMIFPLDRDDLELVLAWRSNPEIYRYFRQQDEPLEWEEHVKWFESRSTERYDFVIHYDGRRVGGISLDASNRVSIYLGDFSARNQGVATSTLHWLCHQFEDRTPLIAEIHKSNASSKQLFTRCGFQQQGCEGPWLQYIYDP
jgi:RimJ/RimL family protein N-acetyltransferase